MGIYSVKHQCLSGVLLTIFIIISFNGVRTDVFKSRPTTVKTFENDSVLLPCFSTEHFTRVRWLDSDKDVIADSDIPQIQSYDKVLHTNGSLEFFNVQLNDTGDYVCELTIRHRVYKQVNTIEVQVSPEVITYPSGIMNITLGGIFQITCEPKGVPYPIISWYHNNKIVTNTDESKRRLTVEVKHYDMGGPIECVADNKVGQPASSGIFLLVNFAPEIIVKNPVVHTKAGVQAKLECIVLSHPRAQIHWFFNGKPILKSNNYFMTLDTDLTMTEALPSHYSKRRHVLVIRNVCDSDLGNYECKAENSLGLVSHSVKLIGNPLRPVFDNKSSPVTANSKLLSWHTQSLSPVIDYKFKFRKVKTGNENFKTEKQLAQYYWKLLTIPADKDSTGPFHTKSYKLVGLEPGIVYEVVIQARNHYGYSEESKIFLFSTPSVTDIISSSSTESNEYDSRYDEDLQNEIYPSPYNAGLKLSSMGATVSFTFLSFVANFHF